jgi:hypothetical protein
LGRSASSSSPIGARPDHTTVSRQVAKLESLGLDPQDLDELVRLIRTFAHAVKHEPAAGDAEPR